MSDDKIKSAIKEATRFVNQATALLQVSQERGMHPKESGAARRSSLDLTRSLAAMRKP